ncbi:hypothetical protein V2W45_1338761 [Cenococcum geophilum]
MSKLALEKKANMVTGSDCLSHIMSRSINRAWEQLGLVLEISLQFHALALMDFVFKMDRLLFVKPSASLSSPPHLAATSPLLLAMVRSPYDMIRRITTPYFYLGQDSGYPAVDGSGVPLNFFPGSTLVDQFTLGPTRTLATTTQLWSEIMVLRGPFC